VKALVNGLTALVSKRPAIVLATVIILTVLVGSFVPQVVITDGNDGFAPDAEELLAQDRISELFGDESSASVLQVIVSAEDGDVVDADGVAAVQVVSDVIRSSELAPLLTSTAPGQPEIISFLLPIDFAVQQGGAPVPTTDAEVKGTFTESFSQLPPDVAGISSSLLSGDKNLEAATAKRGLLLVFIDAPGFDEKVEGDVVDPANDFEDFTALEERVAEQIRAASLPAGYSAEPFSFELIFATGDEFQQEVGRLFLMAALIIVIILLFVFWVKPRSGGVGKSIRRTLADMGLTMATILMAITWMQGIGVILGPKYLDVIDDFGPMTQIIPILLIGLGVDYAIHLTTRYREEVSTGVLVTRGMSRALHTVGIALVLATVTTMVGFLTNLVSPIPALKDFGLLSAVGIAASFLLMLTFVASVRILLDRRAERNETLPREALGSTGERLLPQLIGRTSWLAEKVPVVVVTVAIVLGGFGAYGWANLSTEFSFTDFVPRPNPLIPTFETLVDEFGGGFGETSQVLVEGDNLATAEGHNAMVAANANLRGTPNVVQFGDQPAAQSPLAIVFSLADPASDTFDPAVGSVAQAIGLQPDGTVPAGADVGSLYEAAYQSSDQTARVLHRTGEGSFDAALFDITTQAGENGAGQLALDLKADFGPITDLGPTAVPTSDEIINNVVVTSLRESQTSSLIITIAAAAGLLMLNFFIESRRPALGLITIFPVALVMLWSFGLMFAFGIAFGPVTATISALAVGIGVPYMIHITHRFQEDRVRCSTPVEAIRSTTTNTGGALAGSALTTVAGFGILMTASTIPFQQFGFVTAYTIALALAGAVLVLPSMLVLWDRWHRRRGDNILEADALEAALGGAE
jgi:predicted RND superfamily exporter protein